MSRAGDDGREGLRRKINHFLGSYQKKLGASANGSQDREFKRDNSLRKVRRSKGEVQEHKGESE
jgi:hypothetical protein